jgi:hypothetical protein
MKHRMRLATAAAVAGGVLCVAVAGAATAASPVRGATYLATFSAGGRGSPVIDDALTVAANGRSFSAYALYGRYSCSNGAHGVIHDTDTPSSPGQRIAINPNGSFAATSHQHGSDFGVAGTYSGTVSGHFVTHQAADLTFRISFTASHASLRCNTGKVRIKALHSKG